MSLRNITTRRHHQNYMGDLDMQPVREISGQVLNEFTPVTPQETERPSPKFHFVDVTIPGAPAGNNKDQEKKSPRGDKSKYKSSRREKDRSRSHRKRKENKLPGGKTSHANQQEFVEEDFIHSATYISRQKEIQQVTASAKKEFIVDIVSKGVPVWQRIPQSEHFSGFGNAFQTQLCSKNANIVPQSRSQNKSSKIPKVYWEDVRPTSNESQAHGSKVSTVDNIAPSPEQTHSVYHLSRSQQQQSSAQSSSSVPLEYVTSPVASAQSHPVSQPIVPLHIDQPSTSTQQLLTSRTGSSLSSHVDSVNPSAGTSSKNVGVGGLGEKKNLVQSEDSPCASDQLRKSGDREITVDLTGDSPEESHQKKSARSREVEEVEEESKRFKSDIESQNTSVEVEILKGDDKHQPYIMKRKFAGRLDGGYSSAITPASWKAGDKVAKECLGALPKLHRKAVEKIPEKHDGGDKKERKGKRERSETTRTQPTKKRRVPETSEHPKSENKGPRVKHYDQSAVRKFLKEQRAQRKMERKLAKEQKERDKQDREERLKKLAEKTKELAETGKIDKETKVKVLSSSPVWTQRQISSSEGHKIMARNSKGTQIGDDLHRVDSVMVRRDSLAWMVPLSPKKKDREKISDERERRLGAHPKLETAMRKVSSTEKETSRPKGKKKSGEITTSNRKDRQGAVNQESISDIISRTLEECDRQVKSSGLSTTTSVVTSLSSLDSDSGTSESSSVVMSSAAARRKERARTLGLMAQRLKERIDQEEDYLRHIASRSGSQSKASDDMQKRIPVEKQPTPSPQFLEDLQNTQGEQRPSPPTQNHHSVTHKGHLSACEGEPLRHLNDSLTETNWNDHQRPISSNIETMTLSEVVACMTSLLPASKAGPKNVLQDSIVSGYGKSGTNWNASEVSRQLESPCSKQNEAPKAAGSIDKNSQSHILSRGSGKSSAYNMKTVEEHLEEVPTLHLPSVPDLKLSGMQMGSFHQDAMQSSEQISRITETQKGGLLENGENYRRIVVNHEKTNKGVLQNDEALVGTDLPTSSGIQERDEAASVHSVRTQNACESGTRGNAAVFSGIIDEQETWTGIENNTMKKHRDEKNLRFFNSNVHRYLSSVSEDTSQSEGTTEDIDWQRVRKELDKRGYVPPEESEYSVQRKDLPEWIKPYIVLCETGSVDNFLQMSPKKEKTEIKGTDMTSTRGRKRAVTDNEKQSEYSKGEIDSDKENVTDEEQNLNDTTLTEGLIADLECSRLRIVHERETQTSISISRSSKSPLAEKGVLKMARKKDIGRATSRHRHDDFVDLKRVAHDGQNVGAGKLSQNKLVSNVQKNRDGCRENTDHTSPFTPRLKAVSMSETKQNGSEYHTNISALPCAIEDSVMEVSLEEGKIESMQSSSQTTGGVMESCNTLSSSVVALHDTTGSSASSFHPHELLDQGYINFSPSNLRMRLNAELEYQDTVTEALQQIQELGTMQTVACLQQKHDLTLAEALAEQQKQAEGACTQEEKKKELEKEIQSDKKMKHNDYISNIEKLEKEANERLAALEKDVRARAERILASAVPTPPQETAAIVESPQAVTGSQPAEVIAAAAVAAVGATLTHWERLQSTQKGESSKNDLRSQFSRDKKSSVSVISTRSNQYSSFTSCSASSSQPVNEISHSEKHSVMSELTVPEDPDGSTGFNQSLSSVVEEISGDTNSKKSLTEVAEELSTVSKSSVSLVAECKNPKKFASSVVEELTGSKCSQYSESLDSHHSTGSDVEELSGGKMSNRSSLSLAEDLSESIRSKQSLSHTGNTFSRNAASEQSISSVAEVISQDTVSRDSLSSVAELSQHRISLSYDVDGAKNVTLSEHSIPEEYLSSTVKTSEEVIETESIHNQFSSASKVASISVVQEVSAVSGSVTKTSSRNSSSRQSKESVYSNNQGISHKMSSRSSKSKTAYSRTSSSTASSSTDTNTKLKPSSKSVPSYSESFDAESTSESNESVKSLQKDFSSPGEMKELPLVLSKNFATSGEGGRTSSNFTHTNSFGGSALGVTLNLMESLQKEEQVRQQHQRALLKLQERALIQEARWKLAALHAEGGPNVRKRERAILLQLREQRTHLRRLIEAQNLGAQQRRILLLQHQHLLATSSGANVSGTRGQFPITGSLPVTPRLQLQDMSASSSEPLEEFSFSSAEEAVSLRTVEEGRSKGRKEEEISRERRKLVEDRKRGGSFLEAKKSQEGKLRHSSSDEHETGRVRNRMLQEKESAKNWKKEARRVKEKSPSPVLPPPSTLKGVVTESSVAEESIEASMNDTQSSITEEVQSDTASHSDLKSSVSDQVESDQVELETMSKAPVFGSTPEELSIMTGSVRTKASTLEEDIKSHTQTPTDKSTILTETSRLKGSISQCKSIGQGTQQSSQGDSGSFQSVVKSVYEDSLESGSLSELAHQRSDDSKSSRTVTAQDETETGTRESVVISKSGSASQQKLLSSRNPPLPFRVPLSPRSPHRQNYRRYSSESDDSFTLSQNETASDLSDGEGRLFALREQLAARKAEADKLKREKRRMRRERLASQEQALKKQIASYDSFIQQARLDLEKEIREAQVNAAVKPVIKKPQVAETKKSKKTDVFSSPERSEISDMSVMQDSSIRDSISNTEKKSVAEDRKTLEFETEKESRALCLEESSEKMKAQECPQEFQDVSSESKVLVSQQDSYHETQSLTVSEDYSFEEEMASSSEQTSSTQSSPHKSLSRGSSVDTDHSPSQASSTETIVHSPTKHEFPLADEDTDQGVNSHTVGNQKSKSTDSIIDGTQKDLPQLAMEGTPTLQIDEEVKSRVSSETSSIEEAISEMISEVGSVENNKKSQKMEGGSSQSASENTSISLSELGDILSYNKSEDLTVRSEGQEDLSSVRSSSKSEEVKYASRNKSQQNYGQEIVFPVDLAKSEPSESVQSKSSESCDSKSVMLSSESNKSAKLIPQIPPTQQETKKRKEKLANDITQQVLKTLIDDTKDFLSRVLHCKNKQDPLSKAETKIISSQGDGSVPIDISFAKESDFGKVKSGFIISSSKSSTCYASQEVPFLPKHPEKHESSSANETEETMKLSLSPRSNTEELQKDSCFPRSDKESSSSSKSQILKRVSDLIAESGQSPRSASSVSVTPPLTPQITFDLSPDEEEEPKVVQRSSCIGSSEIQKDGKNETDMVEQESANKSMSTSTFGDGELDAASPSHNHIKASEYSLDLDALTCKLMALTNGDDKELDLELDHQDKAEDAEFAVEGIEGDWFDDDFWSSADARKKQQQLKAEEEKISAEIARLEELQKLQQQYPDLVLRDIPNKPPPPYSPPSTTATTPGASASPSSYTPQSGVSPAVPTAPVPPPNQASGNLQGLQPQTPSNTISVPHRLSKADLRKLATEIFHAVPSQKDEVMSVIEDTVSVLFDAMQEGQDPSIVQPPQHILQPAKTSSEEEDDDDTEDEEGSARTFRLLLFSLGAQLFHQIYIAQNIPPPPPWILKKSLPHPKTLFLVRHNSKARLLEYVRRQVEILLGWEPPAFKESMILRWAKKRRDLVDQVLVRELQSEEMSWTQYDEDEAAVKVQVSGEIFDSLIEETATLFTVIISKKISLM